MIDDLAEKSCAKYRRDFAVLEARRRQGMTLLAKGLAQAEVARAVGVSRMTVMRWERLRTMKPRVAWKRRRLGRPPARMNARAEAGTITERSEGRDQRSGIAKTD